MYCLGSWFILVVGQITPGFGLAYTGCLYWIVLFFELTCTGFSTGLYWLFRLIFGLVCVGLHLLLGWCACGVEMLIIGCFDGFYWHEMTK